MRIAYKLMLSFMTLAMFTGIVGYLGTYNTQIVLKQHIGENYQHYTQDLFKKLEIDMNNKIVIFQVFAEGINFQNKIIKSNRIFENKTDLQTYINEKDKDWVKAPRQTITPFMKKILNNELSRELSNKLSYLNQKYGRMVFGEAFVSNRFGAVIAASGKTSDYRQNDETWWRKTMEQGTYLSSIVYDKSVGFNAIDICLKLSDKDHNFIGTLKIVMNVEELGHLLQKHIKKSAYEKTVFHIISDEKIILSSDSEPENRISNPLNLFIKDVSFDYKGHMEGLGRNKEKVLFTYARPDLSGIFGKSGWILLIENDLKTMYAPITKLKSFMFTIPLILTIFAVIIGLYISKTISSPLVALSKTARKIGDGHLDSIITISSNDEIGQLATAFKKMTDNIKHSTTSIETLNKEMAHRKLIEKTLNNRTASLAQKVNELNCLIDISNMFEKKDLSNDEIIQKTIDRVISAWELPSTICGRIVLGDKEYETPNFKPTQLKLTSIIDIHGTKPGKIEVGYIKELLPVKGRPFLREEQNMIDTIAKQLGRFIRSQIEEENTKKLERQLLQSEKMASIGQLSAGVAHEINNPTGFVSSNLKTLEDYQNDLKRLINEYRALPDLLKKQKGEMGDESEILWKKLNRISELEKEIDIDFVMDDLSELISESREGTDRIKKIVADMKDFAHPGSDKMKLTDINKSMDSTLNFVWNELKYKAEIKKECGSIPQITCYPQQLNQVFANLLVNAAQAIPEKGEIKIATRNSENNIEIEISDTGSGIEEEKLLKVFDPFYTTKPVGKGTGLGLHIVYNIIQKHGGQIDIKSKIGEGTQFTITLPKEQKVPEEDMVES